MNPALKVQKTVPRVGFEITSEQDVALKQLIPWGLKTALFQALTEDLVKVLDSNKERIGEIVGLIITRQIRFSEIVNLTKKNNADTTT